MKKTIAKVLAAAVALSTVVAPNVKADGIATNGGGAFYQTLNFGDVDILSGNNTQNNAAVTGFDVGKNSVTGEYTSITTRAALNGTIAYYGNNVIWYDSDAQKLVINVNVNAADATIHDVMVESDQSYTSTIGTVNTISLSSDNAKLNQLKAALGLSNTTLTGDALAAAIVRAMHNDSDASVTYKNPGASEIVKSVDTDKNTVLDATVTGMAYSADGSFAATNYMNANINATVALNTNGTLTFNFAPTAAKTALIKDAETGGGVLYARVRLTFEEDAKRLSDGQKIDTRTVWIALTNGSNYEGFVLLKQDNQTYYEVGVNYTVTSEDAGVSDGFVTIDEADTDFLASEYAKGGRLLLDYVYDWDNEEYGLATTDEFYKIRRIGSRVFKGGKFQQISGVGDDGAQYIRIINNGAFRKCKQLKKVNLDTSKKLRKINAKAFYDCKKLATVKLDGRNLKGIGSSAFKGTKSNITFKIKGNSKQVDKAWKMIKKQAPSKAKHKKI